MAQDGRPFCEKTKTKRKLNLIKRKRNFIKENGLKENETEHKEIIGLREKKRSHCSSNFPEPWLAKSIYLHEIMHQLSMIPSA